jgi:hypothetical protein
MSELYEWDPPWTAHEHPERPLDTACWLCDCQACHMALRAAVLVNPEQGLVLKTGFDRIHITAERLLRAMEEEGGAEALLVVEGDYIREVFVTDKPVPRGR